MPKEKKKLEPGKLELGLKKLEADNLKTGEINLICETIIDEFSKAKNPTLSDFVSFLERVDYYESRIRISVAEILTNSRLMHLGFRFITEQSPILTLDPKNYRPTFLRFAICPRPEQIQMFIKYNEIQIDRFIPNVGLTMREYLTGLPKTEFEKLIVENFECGEGVNHWLDYLDLRGIIALIRLSLQKKIDPKLVLVKLNTEKKYSIFNFPPPGFHEIKFLLQKEEYRKYVDNLLEAAFSSQNSRQGHRKFNEGPLPKRARTVADAFSGQNSGAENVPAGHVTSVTDTE